MRVIGLEIDIANNIKTVELLKVELLQKVTDLFGDISAETDCETDLHRGRHRGHCGERLLDERKQ